MFYLQTPVRTWTTTCATDRATTTHTCRTSPGIETWVTSSDVMARFRTALYVPTVHGWLNSTCVDCIFLNAGWRTSECFLAGMSVKVSVTIDNWIGLVIFHPTRILLFYLKEYFYRKFKFYISVINIILHSFLHFVYNLVHLEYIHNLILTFFDVNTICLTPIANLIFVLGFRLTFVRLFVPSFFSNILHTVLWKSEIPISWKLFLNAK